jgi:hypothetical protein
LTFLKSGTPILQGTSVRDFHPTYNVGCASMIDSWTD